MHADEVATDGRLQRVASGDAAPDVAITGGAVLSVHTREWLDADVLIAGERIAAVVPRTDGSASHGAAAVIDATGRWVVPGYIDAHVHIESSMLTIAGFAEAVVPRGTTTVVAEPHEIANVLGVAGTTWFMDSAEGLPLDCRFMVPSCVPASQFESPSAPLGPELMEQLLTHPRAIGVGELMNFPAIIAGDPEELAKARMPGSSHADGHAPGVMGRMLDAYVAAGIGSDHEATTWEEALEKRRRGMWVLLREASNARNLRDLLELVRRYGPERCAFCTDDRDPGMLITEGHMDQMVRTAIEEGIDPRDAIALASIGPALAHGLGDVGAIVPGAVANLNILPDLVRCTPDEVVASGRLVARSGRLIEPVAASAPASVRDTVRIAPFSAEQLHIMSPAGDDDPTVRARVIGARDGQLLTDHLLLDVPVRDGRVQTDATIDLAKIAVVERHHATGRVGLGLVQGFTLSRGAVASTVAHDHHNIVVVGMDDASMTTCIERLADIGGGIVVADGGDVVAELALPIAGLMSDRPAAEVAAATDRLHAALSDRGVTTSSPLIMLSFLALSVIPSLKLTDLGLVDVESFELVDLLAGEPARTTR